MILLPISSENKTVLLIPWDNYRTSLILRTTVCFTIAVLTCLGSIALMSYAIINGNWVFFGMSLGIILLLISVALILDLPVKNKFFGTTLTNEISQDISNVGVESIEKCRVAFANIRNTFIPNMRDLHNKLLNDYDTVISN
ncbi:putative inner membrane domain protein, partial [Chlamydia psittaci 84-8471/1]